MSATPDHDPGNLPATTNRPGSPLRDPRALGSSFGFHLVLLGLIALAVAVGIGLPRGASQPRARLRAEVEIDNRVIEGDDRGGGAPGKLGGFGRTPAPPGATRGAVTLERDSGRTSAESAADAVARALLGQGLAEVFGADRSEGRRGAPALATGEGVLPDRGLGGGGGSGGGSGGGVGRGVGPGTEFFGAREQGRSFVYVIDCSGSMINHGALRRAKAELLASLDRLPPDARFGVIFFNLDPTTIADTAGRPGLMPATAANKAWAADRLEPIAPDGGTRPRPAVQAALAMKPEVVFLLTDGQELNDDDVEILQPLASASDTRIHVIEFGTGPSFGLEAPLPRLAEATGGTYHRVDPTARPDR
jgi:hypothetical protein